MLTDGDTSNVFCPVTTVLPATAVYVGVTENGPPEGKIVNEVPAQILPPDAEMVGLACTLTVAITVLKDVQFTLDCPQTA